MKRLAIFLVVILWAPSVMRPLKAAALPAFEHTLIGIVKADSVNIGTTWTQNAQSIGQLSHDERTMILGRNSDSTWVYVHTYFGHGYALADDFSFEGDLTRVPVVEGNLPVVDLPNAVAPDDPQQYPILPVVDDYTHEIYQRGLKLGNRPAIFSKLGDCMSADRSLFLGRFGDKYYQLGQHYQYLQGVIDYYLQVSPRKGVANSFIAPSFAAYTGFNVSFTEDSQWLHTNLCPPTDTPVNCEYRISRPSIAIIMFGTNDISALTPLQFDYFLRLVTYDSIDHGVIPLLSTFPGYPPLPEKTNLFNQIILRVAQDYDVPVMNLWLALQPLPGHGLNPGSMYLSWTPQAEVSFFTGQNLAFGHTMRNLVTLQSLDILWRQVIQPSTSQQ